MADTDPFNKIVAESGNKFHAAVATAFRERNWTVVLSPYYVDNATGKAREIDLICEKLWEFPKRFESTPPKVLRIQLLIECKYIKPDTSTVLWFDGRDRTAVHDLICSSMPFFENNTYREHHHYHTVASNSVAKLFESQPKRGDQEPLYIGLSQCLGALIQLRGSTPLTKFKSSNVGETFMARYPVIVCSDFDRFRQTDLSGAAPRPIHNNFLMEVTYAWVTRNGAPVREYALVDVVSMPLLWEFLQALENEVTAVSALLGD